MQFNGQLQASLFWNQNIFSSPNKCLVNDRIHLLRRLCLEKPLPFVHTSVTTRRYPGILLPRSPASSLHPHTRKTQISFWMELLNHLTHILCQKVKYVKFYIYDKDKYQKLVDKKSARISKQKFKKMGFFYFILGAV